MYKSMPKVGRSGLVAFATVLFFIVAGLAIMWSLLSKKEEKPAKNAAALHVGQVRVTEGDLQKYAAWSDKQVVQAACPALSRYVAERDFQNKDRARDAWLSCWGHVLKAVHFEERKRGQPVLTDFTTVPPTKDEVIKLAVRYGIFKE